MEMQTRLLVMQAAGSVWQYTRGSCPGGRCRGTGPAVEQETLCYAQCRRPAARHGKSFLPMLTREYIHTQNILCDSPCYTVWCLCVLLLALDCIVSADNFAAVSDSQEPEEEAGCWSVCFQPPERTWQQGIDHGPQGQSVMMSVVWKSRTHSSRSNAAF